MMGGEDDPCVNKGVLAYIKREYGRPCPRIELEPENVTAAQVTLLIATQPEFVLTKAALDVEIEEAPAWERRSFVRRLVRVFSDDDVIQLVNRRLKGDGRTS